METLLISLLKNSPNKLATIKRIIDNSNLPEAYKSTYATDLINIARKHNLM